MSDDRKKLLGKWGTRRFPARGSIGNWEDAVRNWVQNAQHLEETRQLPDGTLASIWRSPYDWGPDACLGKHTDLNVIGADLDTRAMGHAFSRWFNLPDDERTDKKWLEMFSQFFFIK